MERKAVKLMIMFLVLALGLAAQADVVTQYSFENNLLDTASGGEVADNLKVIGAPISYEEGIIGQAVRTAGGTMLNADQSPDVAMSNCRTFTVEAFVKPEDLNASEYQLIVTNYTTAYRGPYYLALRRGSFGCIFRQSDLTERSMMQAAVCIEDQWQHVAFTADGSQISVWFNGVRVRSLSYDGTHADGLKNLTGLKIGGTTSSANADFIGLIDEVVLHDEAKDEDYMLSRSILIDPALKNLTRVVESAKTLLVEQNYQEAITLLENSINQGQQWKKDNPNFLDAGYQKLSSDLNMLLVETKAATGASTSDVAAYYKRALESAAPFSRGYMSALEWFYENVSPEEYAQVITTLLEKNSDFLRAAIARSQELADGQETNKAIKFLQDNIAAYEQWQEKHPLEDVEAEKSVAKAYYTLARTQEAAGGPFDEIADMYAQALLPSATAYIDEQSAALGWLVENAGEQKVQEVFRTFSLTKEINPSIRPVIRKLCRDYESKKDWPAFESYLDTLFNQAKYPYEWVVFVESCFTDQNSRWAKTYAKYYENKPELKFYFDRALAEQCEADNNFQEALERYQNLVSRCEPEDDRADLEFRCCRCLFLAGKYQQAASTLEDFIAQNKSRQRNLIIEAMLLKGQAHLQLGEYDQGSKCFFTVMMEYPESQKAADASFFLGYCYILQNKFELAAEAFENLVKSYPQSSYANRARINIDIIKDEFGNLTAKPLPIFEDIDIVFSPEKYPGKSILLCFWDMQQRPSRHYITELAKRAGELSKENVIILAVQVPNVDEKNLQQWTKENHIPFPIGMITGDEEKVRSNWHIQSLPWLILTNGEHVVQAEGFGLAEIDEKIKKDDK